MECVFCEVSGDGVLLKNDDFVAILDAAPVSRGHCLAMPRKHVVSLFDLDNVVGFHIFLGDLKKILDDSYHPDGYNIGVNEGRAAGRTIDHLHVHVIPRYEGDVPNPRGGVRNLMPNSPEPFHNRD